jgi:hypothetical protein
MQIAITFRSFLLVLGMALVAGCNKNDLKEPPVALGDFDLGLNIVVADNMEMVPISREATVEEWEKGIIKAVDDRFGRYDGNRFYNIGIAVDGYALAPPGVPIVVSPKSVVVVTANIWDDASQTRLNAEPKQFTIFENLDGNSVIGSGLTKNKQQQIDALSYNVAKALENWFLDNPQWFGPGAPVPGPPPKDGVPAASPVQPAEPKPAAAPDAAPAADAGLAPPGSTTIRPTRRPSA